MSEYCEARRETNPLAGLTSGFARILTGTHSLTHWGQTLVLTLSLGTDTLVRLLRLLNAGIRSGKYETAEVEN